VAEIRCALGGASPHGGGAYAVVCARADKWHCIYGAEMGKMALKWAKASVEGILMPNWARFRPPNMPWAVLKTFLIPLGGLIWPN
jgi:hypothetical protein